MHVLIRDQAGLLRSAHPFGAAFGWLSRCARLHLRDGDPRLPGNLRIVDLPPYSPELNACEQLWDILKDDIANRVFPTISKLRTGMRATLQRYWENSSDVLSLIGRQWMQVQLNASHKIQQSF